MLLLVVLEMWKIVSFGCRQVVCRNWRLRTIVNRTMKFFKRILSLEITNNDKE